MLKRLYSAEFSPWLILVLLGLGWRLVFTYWTPVALDYPAPPGDDAAFHILRVQELLRGNWSFSFNGYPLGFHAIIAFLAKLFNLNALQSVTWFAPLLLVIPVIVIYKVGKVLIGDVGASVAAFMWATLSYASIRAFGDGNYANLLAGSTLLPLAVLAVHQFVKNMTRRSLIITVLLFFLIGIVHHLSLIYLWVVLFPWLTMFGIERLWHLRHRDNFKRYIGTASLLFIAGLSLFWVGYGRYVLHFVTSLFDRQARNAYFGSANAPISVMQLIDVHGWIFMVCGLLGLIAVVVGSLNRSVKLLLVGWVFILILLSVTPLSGLPGRFVRELAIPLALSSGYGFYYLWEKVRTMRSEWMITLILILLAGFGVLNSFNRPFGLPNPYIGLMRVQKEELRAYQMVSEMTKPGDYILTNNSNPFIPVFIDRKTVMIEDVNTISYYIQYPAYVMLLGTKPANAPEEVYPYYRNYDKITATLRGVTFAELVKRFEHGTEIYRLKR